MKKEYLAAGLALFVVLIGGVFFLNSGKAEPEDTTNKKRKIVEPTNVIDVLERPVVYVHPEADGRNISIEVIEVKKPAKSVEFELEYQAGTLLQGAFGQLTLDTFPASEKVLLGSCSAGGACTYHEDVQGGSLVLRFNGDESYALKQDWKYIENTADDTAHSSRDAKFQIDSSKLATSSYIVIYNSPGFPELPTGQTAASEAYALSTSNTVSGEAELTIRSNQEGDLTILGWNGKDWTEFKTTTQGKSATATVELMDLYIVTTK